MTATAKTLGSAGPLTPEKVQAAAHLIQTIAGPLLAVLAEPQPTEGAARTGGMAELIESTFTLTEAMLGELGLGDDKIPAAVKLQLAGAAAGAVAAHYRGAGEPMPATLAASLAGELNAFMPKAALLANAEKGPAEALNHIAFRAKTLEAMSPVINALMQYAFGRSEHSLLADIADRIYQAAAQITRALAPSNATPEDWRTLCWSIIKTGGQLYVDAHFAEADRILYLPEEERTEYLNAHNGTPPLDPVWITFDQRMAMLATLLAYVDVPAPVEA